MNCILSVFTGHMNCIGKKSNLNAPRKRCMKICFSFWCNSYGLWTLTKCDSILIFTSFYNKVWRDIAFFNTKMSYLSDSKRTKSKTLGTANKQMDDNLNKAALWSSGNNTNKRLIFLKFDYRNTSSYFFTIYMLFTSEMDIGKGVLAINIYNFIRA